MGVDLSDARAERADYCAQAGAATADRRRRQVESITSSDSIARWPDLAGRPPARLLPRARAQPSPFRLSDRRRRAVLGGLCHRQIRALTVVLHGGADTVADPCNANPWANKSRSRNW
jgi:hypothetical protein